LSGAPQAAQSASVVAGARTPASGSPQSRQNADTESLSRPQRGHRAGFAIGGKIVE
jgi:hypothetical protein